MSHFKPDHEPLLAAGRYEYTPSEFYSKFVVGLGGNRMNLWDKFKMYILEPIQEFDIKCELWVDGSFITKCDEPSDIDGTIMVPFQQLELMSETALKYLKKFDDSEDDFVEGLDFFVCKVYPRNHDDYGGDNDPDGWAWQWSKERNSSWLKGFVVIPFR